MSAGPTTSPHREMATTASIIDGIRYNLRYEIGTNRRPTREDLFRALALTLRRHVLDRFFETEARYDRQDVKRLYYLSMEFLIGRLLGNNLLNLGLLRAARDAVSEFGFDFADIEDVEPDAALGNGGLGRLAACFLDSLATLDMPGFGYGLHYEFGLFKQEIRDGRQYERPDHWMSLHSPWLVERSAEIVVVPVYGRIEHGSARDGQYSPKWLDWQAILGVPYDVPVVGYGGRTVNYLRLYAARSSDEFDLSEFNSGDYLKAVDAQIQSESISKILYPSDNSTAGKELRLVQEYFLVACAVRDILRRHLQRHASFDHLADKVAIQLNDTHPALTVVELMRTFLDEHAMEWDDAWAITEKTCAFTNHTLLPEALERWPLPLLERVLPRHAQIIREINDRFLTAVALQWPDDPARVQRVSLLEGDTVRMAHLAMIGSHSVNGVAALHSRLITTQLVPELYALMPEKFGNKTNGVTHRRWVAHANPGLAEFLTERVGPQWLMDLSAVRGLEASADDAASRDAFRSVRRANKERLAALICRTTGQSVDPDALFDVQVKRIHEYKRQLLHVLAVLHEYHRIVDDGVTPAVPRVHIFAGKAAPGYAMAKLIIHLIHRVSGMIQEDERVGDALRVVFVPDYKVSVAEVIMPAADVSEQVSTAGYEASGTGNMKLAMNGALTVGTLDGANIEIADAVGRENVYIFGLTAEEVRARQAVANLSRSLYEKVPAIRRVVDTLTGEALCGDERETFRPIVDALLVHGDPYLHLADLESYIATQERVAADFLDADAWARRALLNVARTDYFTSDRTVREYAHDIWSLTRAAV